ncbi:transcriptional regulator family: Fungal Specific TF [Penicillium taxi]|uniref:transcriptional regulator family: Fungal Specific TF n=1 Tax=Penicillium taxi TaxID=168475 RepID=UPI0025454CEB|nr:transcriptional regulator family: Fungal Specific TF [Penicillium taxi]KAJ5908072.1 transcriptional regulator family: Fungal Specific TF [Penicillium taxi]
MRSRTGCLTCRTRKLKCDEQKPQCSQCRKGGRECRPSEGIVFRHQQNASMNNELGEPPEGRGNLKGFYSYKNTFDKDSVWLDVPERVVFVDNSDPYVDDLEASLAESSAMALAQAQSQRWSSGSGSRASDTDSHSMDAMSTVVTHDRLPFSPLDHPSVSDSVSYPSPNRPRSSAMPPPSSPSIALSANSNNTNINFLLNPSQSISPPVDPIMQTSSQRRTSQPPRHAHALSRGSIDHKVDTKPETDFEVAFLLRHYSKGPGLWMDLFDEGTYFASNVPVRAISNPLLKYAACAYAAKQLGRVRDARAKMGECSRQAMMEVWPDKDTNFMWVGAKYYEKAIQLLMKQLQPDAEGPPPLSTPEAFGQWQAAELCEDGQTHKRRRRLSNSRLSRGVHSDEVLAATAILSVYEFLDATDPAWNRHLSGVKGLLDVAEVGIMPLESRSSDGDSPYHLINKSRLSKARRAAFWNFARQDYLAAFINECHTRLNTDDLILWTEAGLHLDSMGFVRPSNTTTPGSESEDNMKEDQICNSLVWILSKIVNYINSSEGLSLNDGQSIDNGPMSVSQQMLLERWYRLEAELDTWYSGLPDTFRPSARIGPSYLPHCKEAKDLATLQEIWHSMPMCASSMQHYHMARILLLINKPVDSTKSRSTITLRLQSYRSIEVEIGAHSREIVGIALSRPDGSVRINSLQPLFVSGQCLSDPRERRVTIFLLRDIESDLGWATEYRVQQLLKEWDWDESFLHSIET